MQMKQQLPVLAEVTRSGMVESRHRGSVVVADAEGTIHALCGDGQGWTYMRSCAKPVQALPLVESGAADRFGFTEQELAVCCASHAGEVMHRGAVQRILDKIGLSGQALACGIHPPYNREERRRLLAEGREPDPIHHNCSGKHSGMLAVCVHRGWPVEGYLDPDHPLQVEILQCMSDLTGIPRDEIRLGVDGCGVPVFGLPLVAMARVFAHLASDVGHPDHRDALRRIRAAMIGNPEYIAGSGQFDTLLMQQSKGRVVAKSGAEGVFCCGLTGRGWGMAVKIEDGSTRAIPPVVVQCLAELSVLTEADLQALANCREPEIRNNSGLKVGAIRAVSPVFSGNRTHGKG